MKGEFEKRINKMLELTNFSSGKSPDYEQARVRQIIDEAQKEFPLLTKELEEKYPLTWADELNSLRLQWFKKWVGDEK